MKARKTLLDFTAVTGFRQGRSVEFYPVTALIASSEQERDRKSAKNL